MSSSFQYFAGANFKSVLSFTSGVVVGPLIYRLSKAWTVVIACLYLRIQLFLSSRSRAPRSRGASTCATSWACRRTSSTTTCSSSWRTGSARRRGWGPSSHLVRNVEGILHSFSTAQYQIGPLFLHKVAGCMFRRRRQSAFAFLRSTQQLHYIIIKRYPPLYGSFLA